MRASLPAFFATLWIASRHEKYTATPASSVLRGAVPSTLHGPRCLRIACARTASRTPNAASGEG